MAEIIPYQQAWQSACVYYLAVKPTEAIKGGLGVYMRREE